MKSLVGHPGRRGVALLLTLLAVGLLSASTVYFIRMTRLEATVAENVRSFTQAHIFARAGLEGAMTILALDDGKYDASSEPWAKFDQAAALSPVILESGSFTGRIEDLSARFNINTVIDPKGLVVKERLAQLERLFDLLELDKSAIPALLDWLDPDDETRPGGAEESYYAHLPRPYPCGNGPFEHPGRPAQVKGWAPFLRPNEKGRTGPMDLITVHSDGLININTAGEAVLMSLDDGLTRAVAQEIITRRTAKPFAKLDELKETAGVTPQLFARLAGRLTVSSNWFLVVIEGRHREARVMLTAVVRRSGSGVKIVFYQLG
ncbi:MAG: type II secretion system minor pseudopilin GspK [Thermodesulfobacteriota bacterium]